MLQVQREDRADANAGSRLPLLTEAAAMVRDYLAAEQDLGRVAAAADIATLAPMLTGAVHLLYAGADGPVWGRLAADRLPRGAARLLGLHKGRLSGTGNYCATGIGSAWLAPFGSV